MSNIVRLLPVLMVSVAVVFACAGTSMCETLDVYPGVGTPVQDAIDGAEPGNTIYVHVGLYYENLVVRKPLTLIGENRSTTVINGDGSGDIIKVTADGCTISGFTLQGSDDCVWAEKTLAGGEVWDLGGGFALTPAQIDVDGEKVWFSFTKDGRGYDDEIMSVGDVYTFTADIDGEEDVPVLLCCVIGMYIGTESTFVQIRYVLFDDHLLGTNTGDFVEEATGLWPIAGIRLSHADSAIVTDNEIRLCDCGIRLQYSDDNVFTANIASDNNYGIALRGLSNGNIFYHNNLINNIQDNAYDEGSANQWDSGSAGNYYSDYNGTDNNTDGIGDDPHPIPGGGSIDRFPLMQPWTLPQRGDLNSDGNITPADAAIALRMAVHGEYSDIADMSSDNRVTSLDALMILQMAVTDSDITTNIP